MKKLNLFVFFIVRILSCLDFSYFFISSLQSWFISIQSICSCFRQVKIQIPRVCHVKYHGGKKGKKKFFFFHRIFTEFFCWMEKKTTTPVKNMIYLYDDNMYAQPKVKTVHIRHIAYWEREKQEWIITVRLNAELNHFCFASMIWFIWIFNNFVFFS